MKLNNNAWLNRLLLRATYLMPVSLNSDREIEFEEVRGYQIGAVIDYWKLHLDNGSITDEQHHAISKLILIGFERKASELGLLTL